VSLVAHRIAEEKEIKLEEVASITTQNAIELFKLSL
jgi:Tat protein secretion system quality control protein TatD with DNase activity